MTDVEQLVRRAVDAITTIARKAARLATLLLLTTVVVCVGGLLLGIAALSDGVETVWTVLGIVFGSIAIGSAVTARWRVGTVRRHVPELAREVRTIVTEGSDSSRTVIETFAVDDPTGTRDPGTGSAIVLSRQMHGFRSAAGGGLDSSVRLAAAIRALTTFPILVLTAIAISLVFAFFGAIFLLALAL